MLRLMATEVADALDKVEGNDEPGLVSLATGRLPYPYMEKYAVWIRKKFPNRTINIYPIRNDFFGERITVSGLITAKDLIAQLKGKDLGRRLLIPANMLRYFHDTALSIVHYSQRILDMRKVSIFKSHIYYRSHYLYDLSFIHDLLLISASSAVPLHRLPLP